MAAHGLANGGPSRGGRTGKRTVSEDDAEFAFLRWQNSGRQAGGDTMLGRHPYELLKALNRFLNADVAALGEPDEWRQAGENVNGGAVRKEFKSFRASKSHGRVGHSRQGSPMGMSTKTSSASGDASSSSRIVVKIRKLGPRPSSVTLIQPALQPSTPMYLPKVFLCSLVASLAFRRLAKAILTWAHEAADRDSVWTVHMAC